MKNIINIRVFEQNVASQKIRSRIHLGALAKPTNLTVSLFDSKATEVLLESMFSY